jgi:hypothetical protein
VNGVAEHDSDVGFPAWVVNVDIGPEDHIFIDSKISHVIERHVPSPVYTRWLESRPRTGRDYETQFQIIHTAV